MNIQDRLKRLESKVGINDDGRLQAIIVQIIESDGSLIEPRRFNVGGLTYDRCKGENLDDFESRVLGIARKRNEIVTLLPA